MKKIVFLYSVILLSVLVSGGPSLDKGGTSSSSMIYHPPEWTITKTGAETFLDVDYEIINDTMTQFCIRPNDIDSYKLTMLVSNRSLSDVPINKTSLTANFDVKKSKLDLSKANESSIYCFNVTYNELRNISFKIGWESIEIDASSGTNACMYGNNDNICRSPNGHLHIVYAGDGNDLFYMRSLNDGTPWGPPIELRDLSTVSMTTVMCAPNGDIFAMGIDSTDDDISIYKSTNGGDTWGTIQPIINDTVMDNGACTVDSHSVVHCCGTDSDDDLWYGNSSGVDNDWEVHVGTMGQCTIEVDDDDNIYIVVIDATDDYLNMYSSVDGYTEHFMVDLGSGASVTKGEGCSLTINDNEVYVGCISSDDLWYINGTISNLSSWSGSEIDSTASYNPNIFYTYNGDIFISYQNSPTDGGNIEYAKSEDKGANWSTGVAYGLGGFGSTTHSVSNRNNRVTDAMYYSYQDGSNDLWFGTMSLNYTEPSLDLDVLYPTTSVDVTQNQFFNVTVNVSCLSNDCGDINVSLDYMDTWADDDMKYKRALTIESDLIVSNQTDFPLLVKFTDLHIRDNTQSDWNDTRFYDSDDSTEIPYDLEDYNSTNGEVIVWVKTDITAEVDKTIYIYYGNSTMTSQEDKTNVWSNGYLAVWHLNEGDNTSTGFYKDSTSYGHNLTLTDADGDSSVVDGIVGGAFDFTGDGDTMITATSTALDINGNDNLTISGWFNLDANAHMNIVCFVESLDSGSSDKALRYSTTSTQGNFFIYDGGYQVAYTNGLSLNTWGYWTGTYDGTTVKHYYDAVKGVDDTATGSQNFISPHVQLGRQSYDPYGILDEIRISTVARSQDWINASFQNQRYWYDFVTLEDGVEVIPQSGTPFTTNNSNPRSIVLNQSQSEEIIFWVNATGDVGQNFSIFAHARTFGPTNVHNYSDRWMVNITNGTAEAPADSCSPSSPLTSNHLFECADNCDITSNINANGFNITVNGTGKFTMHANITNWSRRFFYGQDSSNKCTIEFLTGGFR